MLRLQGAWLERAGFAVGVPVTVRVRAGRLVIDVADPEGADVADPEGAPQTEAFARIARVTDGRVSRRELDALVRRLKRDRID